MPVATCLITGGAGFIGSHLTEALVARGDEVRVLDDHSTGKLENLGHLAGRIELVRGSVTAPERVATAVRNVEVVFHLAALPSVQRSVENPDPTHDVCATGTLCVLQCARKAGVRRVVYAASSSAYGDTPGAIRVETDQLAPMSPYAAAKLAGEHYCRCFTTSYGLETVRLRLFNIFGPRQDARSPYSGVIARFIALMEAGQRPTVYGDGRQSRDFTYVANAVQALVRAADAPPAAGQVYNVGAGGSTSVLDLIRNLNQLLGSNLEPLHASARPGDVRHSQADISRARRELGYDPAFSFVDGLRRTLDAFRGA